MMTKIIAVMKSFFLAQVIAVSVAVLFYLTEGNYKLSFTLFLIPSFIFSNFNYFAHRYVGARFIDKVMRSPASKMSKMVTASLVFMATALVATEAAMVVLSLVFHYKYLSSLKANLIIIAVSTIIGLMVFVAFFIFELTKRKLELRNLEIEELRQMQLQSKLISLQAKINPHFLFNTLNTVVELAHSDPDKVERIVLNLSDMYRSVLNLPEEGMIPLHQELDLISKYVKTEQERLGDRLKFTITCQDVCRAVMIPPLLIEPLVENAVIHGIAKKRDGGMLTLMITCSQSRMTVTVSDTGKGCDVKHVRDGFGLRSIKERLAIQYKEKASFSMQSSENGTIIIMELPHV